MSGEQLLVHPRAVVEALEVGGGGELQQVAVAGLVLGEQREVVGKALFRVFIEPGVRRDVALHADDRLHTVLLGGLVELDRTVEGAVVRDSERILPQRLRTLHERLDLRQAVEERVLRMRVEVGEHRADRRRLETSIGVGHCANGRS